MISAGRKPCIKKNPSEDCNILPFRTPFFHLIFQNIDVPIFFYCRIPSKPVAKLAFVLRLLLSALLLRVSPEHFFVGIVKRELQHRAFCRPDNSAGNEQVFQSEGFDLLSVFLWDKPIGFEQQKQVVGQHHQLKHGFVSPKGF